MLITRIWLSLSRATTKTKSCLLSRPLINIASQQLSHRKMSQNIQPVTHVIFDMDGLLLDTVTLYEAIRKRILAEFGMVYDFTTNIESQGLLSHEAAEFVIKKFNIPISVKEYLAKSAAVGREVFANAQLMPDTECIYERMISQIVEKYGKKYTTDVKLRVLGTNEQSTAALVVSGCELPITVDEFLVQFRSLQLLELGKCGAMEGAERLVRHLHKNNVPIAVATSSGKESVAVKTKNFQELFGLFHHIVMGSSDPDVKNGKPAPDIFQVCAARFPDKPACEKCLVFEDAPNGVTGARAAGMQTVMVPDPHLPEERTTHSTVVLKSLLDFKPQLFGLPSF